MDDVRTMWARWSPARRWSLLIGVGLIVLLTAAFAWWATQPRYAVLFSGLKQGDAAEIATTLDGWQLPHRFADDGATVLVPSDMVYDTRMKLVAQGVPHGGNVGFETFKDSDFGVTEFAQRVNYQRALQGELERTISSLDEVQSARVHLTLRRTTMFETQDTPSKASVTLALHQGKTLTPKQVTGVQRLVASAVDGLAPDAVVVLGDGGTVLSGNGANAGDGGDEQARIEERLHQRISGMLQAALGSSSAYSVSVDVQLNYDHVKQVRDSLLPQGKDGNGLLTRQKIANTHPTEAGDTDAAHAPAASAEAELEFAHSREQEEVEVAPGKVERISVGILVPETVNAETLAKLHDVIAAAIGLNAQRGDRLDIAGMGSAAAYGATSRPNVIPTTVTAAAAVRPAMAAAPVSTAMPWWQLAALAGGLGLLCFIVGWSVSRQGRPRRLNHLEREKLLRDVQQWIDASEQV